MINDSCHPQTHSSIYKKNPKNVSTQLTNTAIYELNDDTLSDVTSLGTDSKNIHHT